MAMFRKKPVVVEANQWLVHGDHPSVSSFPVFMDYLDPCPHCGGDKNIHGWVQTLEGGYNVCPGDWIITGIKNEKYPCKPDIFAATYEPVEDDQ